MANLFSEQGIFRDELAKLFIKAFLFFAKKAVFFIFSVPKIATHFPKNSKCRLKMFCFYCSLLITKTTPSKIRRIFDTPPKEGNGISLKQKLLKKEKT